MIANVRNQVKGIYNRVSTSKDLFSLIRSAGKVFIYQIFGVAASYLVQVFLARWIGPSGLGNFNFAYNWGRTVSVIGDLGTSLAALKFVPDYSSSNDSGRLKGTLISFTAISFVGSLLLSLALIAFFIAAPPTDVSQTTLIIGLAITPLIALKELYVQVLRAIGFITLAYLPGHVLIHVFLLAGTALVVYTQPVPLNSDIAILIQGGVILLIILWQGWGILRAVPREVLSTKAVYEMGYWIKTSLPMVMIKGFVTIMDRLDIIMVGLLLGSFATGIYSAASRIATLVSFGLYAVDAITAPKISPLYRAGDTAELQRVVRQSSRLSFASSLVLFSGIFIFSGFLLNMFGPEFIAGRTALLIISLAYVLNSLLGPVGYLMHLTNYQKESTRIHAVAIVVNISLNLLLIPTIGYEGAAIATVVAISFQNIWMYLSVRKYLHIDTLPISLVAIKRKRKN